MARLPRPGDSAAARWKAESFRTRASDVGWKTGSFGNLERTGSRELRSQCHEGSKSQRYSAVGRGRLSAEGSRHGKRCSAGQVLARSNALLSHGGSGEVRSDAETNRG